MAVRAILQFFSLYRCEEISKSLSLVVFVLENKLIVAFGIQSSLLWKGPKSLPLFPFSSLSSFSLFEWESPFGDFPCSSFLHDDFANYFSPSTALAICCLLCCLILGMGLILTLSWRMTLLVAISLLFLTELDRGYDSLGPIFCSPSASSSRRDLSSSQVRSHPSMQIVIILFP